MWKTIEGYEGLYQINEDGEILNVKTGKIRKQRIKKNGYIDIDLYDKNHNIKWHRIHRLVAQTFIPNPNNLPIVMHIDNDKSNNNVNNLKWGSISENTKQAFNDGLEDTAKDYLVYSETESYTFHGYKEIMEATGYKSPQSICTALNIGYIRRKGKFQNFKIKKLN